MGKRKEDRPKTPPILSPEELAEQAAAEAKKAAEDAKKEEKERKLMGAAEKDSWKAESKLRKVDLGMFSLFPLLLFSQISISQILSSRVSFV